jgi:hypothetical protein
MKRFQMVVVAYMVSWSTEFVYAELPIKPDAANINYYGHYDFSDSSAAESWYGFAVAIKGISQASKKPIGIKKSYFTGSGSLNIESRE